MRYSQNIEFGLQGGRTSRRWTPFTPCDRGLSSAACSGKHATTAPGEVHCGVGGRRGKASCGGGACVRSKATRCSHVRSSLFPSKSEWVSRSNFSSALAYIFPHIGRVLPSAYFSGNTPMVIYAEKVWFGRFSRRTMGDGRQENKFNSTSKARTLSNTNFVIAHGIFFVTVVQTKAVRGGNSCAAIARQPAGLPGFRLPSPGGSLMSFPAFLGLRNAASKHAVFAPLNLKVIHARLSPPTKQKQAEVPRRGSVLRVQQEAHGLRLHAAPHEWPPQEGPAWDEGSPQRPRRRSSYGSNRSGGCIGGGGSGGSSGDGGRYGRCRQRGTPLVRSRRRERLGLGATGGGIPAPPAAKASKTTGVDVAELLPWGRRHLGAPPALDSPPALSDRASHNSRVDMETRGPEIVDTRHQRV